ncbi:2-amino-4-hydroxy-6-hydroxymethyldihydropteridine diphosphokinase [Henriciella sp. AS95]|uniref:2-amino-4-hydroxy-6- hydroxymethyldihydropteridine diphosphokinase n=1 Tax=Henriciella sp. AS95 TaxID=3135782 RepID=UPI003172AB7F
MTRVALALGANLGDAAGNVSLALLKLDDADGLTLIKSSRLYRTPPWGVEDQPDFINACALFETQLSPEALLALCKGLETEMGRVPGERWGPRLMDIDLLWMEGETRASEGLTLPHPRMTERAFVLVPLGEIAPDLVIDGTSVAGHVGALSDDDRCSAVPLV